MGALHEESKGSTTSNMRSEYPPPLMIPTGPSDHMLATDVEMTLGTTTKETSPCPQETVSLHDGNEKKKIIENQTSIYSLASPSHQMNMVGDADLNIDAQEMKPEKAATPETNVQPAVVKRGFESGSKILEHSIRGYKSTNALPSNMHFHDEASGCVAALVLHAHTPRSRYLAIVSTVITQND